MLVEFLFISILGTLAHFFYEWSGNNFFVGLFCAVNESTWEHMKLFFFPALLYSAITVYFSLKKHRPLSLRAHSATILTGTIAIPVLFYTYRGVLGFGLPAVDISTFYFSVFLALCMKEHLEKYRAKTTAAISIPEIAVAAFFLAFLVFTMIPPALGIFVSPV